MVNPGFESGETAWLDLSNGEIVPEPVRTGHRALEIVASENSQRKVYQNVNVTAGVTYQVKGWMAVDASKSGARLSLQWRSNDGMISSVAVGGVALGTMGWTEKSALIKAPSGATRARLHLVLEKESDGNGSAWFDELSLVRSN
jgi:hypothetical protein